MPNAHSHWSAYDENLEMADFARVHDKVERGEDFSADAAALRDKARSYGYGEADSSVVDLEGRDPALPYTKALQEVFDNYMDGDYWGQIDASENLLSAAAKTPEAKAAVRALCRGMRDGFEEGREDRLGKNRDPVP